MPYSIAPPICKRSKVQGVYKAGKKDAWQADDSPLLPPFCYCHVYKYPDVPCETCDLRLPPLRAVPQVREALCYCHTCKYEVLCDECDLPDGKVPVRFVATQPAL